MENLIFLAHDHCELDGLLDAAFSALAAARSSEVLNDRARAGVLNVPRERKAFRSPEFVALVMNVVGWLLTK
jgi:hypothetical protein